MILELIWQAAMAGVATLCFAVLFCVPKKHWLACGVNGAVGWAVYAAMLLAQPSKPVAALVAGLALTLLARSFAIGQKAPVTVFLVCGIFPLVPGAGIYYTAYYFIQGNSGLSSLKGVETIKVALALALSMAIVLGLPLPRSRCPAENHETK